MLELLTTTDYVVTIFNMQVTLMARRRIVYSPSAFAELVLWQVPKPIAGSDHDFKYRFAYVVNAVCVVRYDNEIGKGDHRHFGPIESHYKFSSPEKLIADFQKDIVRWNHENNHS
jgi:hypothetical protein